MTKPDFDSSSFTHSVVCSCRMNVVYWFRSCEPNQKKDGSYNRGNRSVIRRIQNPRPPLSQSKNQQNQNRLIKLTVSVRIHLALYVYMRAWTLSNKQLIAQWVVRFRTVKTQTTEKKIWLSIVFYRETCTWWIKTTIGHQTTDLPYHSSFPPKHTAFSGSYTG